jgi:hydrogenase maturation factor
MPNWEVYMDKEFIGWLAIGGIFSFVAAAGAQTQALSTAFALNRRRG